MHSIAELNVLLREEIKLPNGVRPAVEGFREGWTFVCTKDPRRLEKQVVRRGWHVIKVADGTLRSGVGETEQGAIASALKLALRRISQYFNAAEVEYIELTRYPWFFLARVRVYPFRIQEFSIHPESDMAPSLPARTQAVPLPARLPARYPQLGSAMPVLRQMLLDSREVRDRVN